MNSGNEESLEAIIIRTHAIRLPEILAIQTKTMMKSNSISHQAASSPIVTNRNSSRRRISSLNLPERLMRPISSTCLVRVALLLLLCANQPTPRSLLIVTADQTGSHRQQQPLESLAATTITPSTNFKPPSSNGSARSQGCLSLELTDQLNQTSQQASAWPLNQKQDKSFGYTQASISDFVKPSFYTLRLKVDPTKQKFSGQLMITLDIGASSSEAKGYRYLTLNVGRRIHIRRAFYVFTSRGSVQIPATNIGKDVDNELLTIDFHPNVITVGQGLLLIVYNGAVNETHSLGLFEHFSQKSKRANLKSRSAGGSGSGSGASEQLDDSGLATHMQPNFARRLFPSWDEPHLKARFNLIVVLPFRNYVTISNMPVKRKSISLSCSGESLQEIEFHTTPTMSTYLLTLVIGRFDFIESITPNNCKLRAYVYSNKLATIKRVPSSDSHTSSLGPKPTATAAAITTTPTPTTTPELPGTNYRKLGAQFALDVAVKTFDRLEFLLGIKYPLSKFDLIALREFDGGGMENWGASIFHENYMLYDNSSQLQAGIQVNGGRIRPKRLVVPLVVAHEIAHQWFGNLLTARTWTYLWLNEGFAQFLMFEISDSLFPSENFWHIFMEDSRQSSMHEDELITSSHALEYEQQQQQQHLNGTTITSTSTVISESSLFDQLTYNKGALVCRMVLYLLGRKQFFAGLHHYLLKHSYDSVDSHDLWLALEESSGLPEQQLESVMHSWLRREGFPLVSVAQVVEDESHYKLTIHQERFTLLNLAEGEQQSNQALQSIWSIPITLSSELDPSPNESRLILFARGQQHQRNENQASVSLLMAANTTTLMLPKSSLGYWFKLNFNATGYFRVDYELQLKPDGSLLQQPTGARNSVDLLARMAQASRDQTMCVIDRFNLVDDLFSMVKAGKKPTAYYLRYLIEAFSEETEIIVLRSIVESLKRIKGIVSNSDIKLNSLFDRYAQKYLGKVGGVISGDSESSGGSGRSKDIHQLQWERRTTSQQQHNKAAARETEDLIQASKLLFNDSDALQKAADLFGRHFRQPSKALFDSMDREMRASIYSGALMSAKDVDLGPNFALNDELPALRTHQQAQQQQQQTASYVTTSGSNEPILSSYSWLSSIFAPANASGEVSLAAGGANQQQMDPQASSQLSADQQRQDIFLKLLEAYASSETSGERFAIVSALGSISLPTKQLMLLNLTVFESYFRPQDSIALLEAMARTKAGRQLVWDKLRLQPELFERRQLFAATLKSLSYGGLLERPNSADSQQQQEIENQLRLLYQTYGQTHGEAIGQAMEIVRINSQWFKRDQVGLRQYLESTELLAPSPGLEFQN